MIENNKSIIIIGAGFAGLAAGIYARLNGYNTRIYEMHTQPGGLCTAWKRKGYTFDGCIHWLVGSSPKSGLHDMWEETGVTTGRKFIDLEEYYRFEDSDGRVLTIYTDIDRLEKSLLEFSSQDEKPIREFKDPLLREAFNAMWVPEFSMLFMLFTFAYLHNKNAGYPVGGSMPMSEALEARYKELGGISFSHH